MFFYTHVFVDYVRLSLVEGSSINYVITPEGGGGEMMMLDDGRGEGVRT